MRKILASLLVASALAGCATTRPSMSYVAPEVTAGDATVLAADAAAWLATPLAPAHTTIILDPRTRPVRAACGGVW